jgi:hypothetical protein
MLSVKLNPFHTFENPQGNAATSLADSHANQCAKSYLVGFIYSSIISRTLFANSDMLNDLAKGLLAAPFSNLLQDIFLARGYETQRWLQRKRPSRCGKVSAAPLSCFNED